MTWILRCESIMRLLDSSTSVNSARTAMPSSGRVLLVSCELGMKPACIHTALLGACLLRDALAENLSGAGDRVNGRSLRMTEATAPQRVSSGVRVVAAAIRRWRATGAHSACVWQKDP